MKLNCILILIAFPAILLSQGKVGVNTDTPETQLDVRALSANESTILNVGNLSDGYFTRLLAGHPGFPVSSLTWATGTPFNFGSWDGMNFTQMMHLSPLRRVGINTFEPLVDLDVRGTDDTDDGGELQLSTPGQTNFLRLFGGRLGDRNPFMAFHDLDTFHIVTTLPDWSTYTRRLTMLPDGRVGIGTELPKYRFTVHSSTVGDTLIAGEAFATNGVNIGVLGKALNSQGIGVKGLGGDAGVHGESLNGNGLEGKGVVGVLGYSPNTNGYGVYGIANAGSGNTHGVYGTSSSNSGIGVYGGATSPDGVNYGVYGESESPTGYGVAGFGAYGVYGFSESAIGVQGETGSTTGSTYGVYGFVNSTSGKGVFGRAEASSGNTEGVYGLVLSPSGTGVKGLASSDTGNTRGVAGFTYSPNGTGVIGQAIFSTGPNIGVHGISTSSSGTGVFGEVMSGSGTTYGVHGKVNSNGSGVYGENTRNTGTSTGVYGKSVSDEGIGIFGSNSSISGTTYGVMGTTPSTSGTGVYGIVNAISGVTNGVYGNALSEDGRGVYGKSSGTNGKALYGYATGTYGKGLHVEATGTHSSVNAILASANNGDAYAGYFIGKVNVSGTLSKTGGSFKIDHPLDPANKYLYHSFVESPDMMNIYNGNVVTDANGNATVELPEYFESLNMDFRYQLTVIGTFAQAIIGEEISGNQFIIRTDQPNVKVSWQVTGVRQDPWAEQNRIRTEVQKEAENIGKYLNPEVYGQPEASRIGRPESGKEHVN